MSEADVALGIDHAEDEQTPDRRQHDDCLEPEELAELVGAEESEWKMDQPEEEAKLSVTFLPQQHQTTHNASIPAEVMPMLFGMWLGMSV